MTLWDGSNYKPGFSSRATTVGQRPKWLKPWMWPWAPCTGSSSALPKKGLELSILRMAAEVVSITFLQCILRGMQRSPRIVDQDRTDMSGVGVEDVSCLVIPDGCLGLPVLAALQQGIPTVAVKENPT